MKNLLQRTLDFALYPSPTQAGVLDSQLEACRQLYNACLEQRVVAVRTGRRVPSEYDQNRQLPEIRHTLPEFARVPAGVMQSVCRRVQHAFDNFWAGRTGFPRFKGKAKFDSFSHQQALKPHGHGTYRFEPRHLYMSSLGRVKHKLRRRPDWFSANAIPKKLHLRRRAGRWQARIIFEAADVGKAGAPLGSAVGLDAGLHHLWATSDGDLIENPRWLQRNLSRLRRQQRKLARRQVGGANRRKQGLVISRIHARIERQRMDYLHKISARLADRYQVVAVEENLSGLLRSRVARSVYDASWGCLRRLLAYKLAERRGHLVQVAAALTSQSCSACAHRQRIGLRHRIWLCKRCGLEIDRDVNAARNVLAGAMAMTNVPRDTRELTPKETGGSWRGRAPLHLPVDELGTKAQPVGLA